MVDGNINIGEAELEIMKVLWQAEEPVNTQYINEAVEKHGWKRTTVSTFLARLVQKEAVLSEKRGKSFYYTPLISQKAYRKLQTKNLITNLYNGSVKDFALALFEEERLSSEDMDELRAIFDRED